MSGIKVMIVDDSPFSRTILAEILKEGGCEVVGEAESIESLVKTYNACSPDIVTMDIAMPGADGFECSKVLLMQNPVAKIILVSSMKDEETEAEARRIGIAGYVQKPVDKEIIMNVINNILSPDTLYRDLESWGLDFFKEALEQNIIRLTKEPVEFIDKDWKGTNSSQGITAVIGIIGKYPGTMILDLTQEGAEEMTKAFLRRPAKNNDEVIAMAAEFSNIVGGIATSMLNKKEKAFGFRVSPPSVFYGAPAEIISPNIYMRSFSARTSIGRIDLSIGFKKGSVLWM